MTFPNYDFFMFAMKEYRVNWQGTLLHVKLEKAFIPSKLRHAWSFFDCEHGCLPEHSDSSPHPLPSLLTTHH